MCITVNSHHFPQNRFCYLLRLGCNDTVMKGWQQLGFAPESDAASERLLDKYLVNSKQPNPPRGALDPYVKLVQYCETRVYIDDNPYRSKIITDINRQTLPRHRSQGINRSALYRATLMECVKERSSPEPWTPDLGDAVDQVSRGPE